MAQLVSRNEGRSCYGRFVRSYNTTSEGTCNLQIDPAGERLFFTFNGATCEPGSRRMEYSGQPSVIVVHVPASER